MRSSGGSAPTWAGCFAVALPALESIFVSQARHGDVRDRLGLGLLEGQPRLLPRGFRGKDIASVPVPERHRETDSKADGVREVRRLMFILRLDGRVRNANGLLEAQIGFGPAQSRLGGDDIRAPGADRIRVDRRGQRAKRFQPVD